MITAGDEEAIDKKVESDFEVVLCSDHDFNLFKDVRFKSNHEIQIDTVSGFVTFNTGENVRYVRKNLASVGLFLTTFAYVSYLYRELQVDNKTLNKL